MKEKSSPHNIERSQVAPTNNRSNWERLGGASGVSGAGCDNPSLPPIVFVARTRLRPIERSGSQLRHLPKCMDTFFLTSVKMGEPGVLS